MGEKTMILPDKVVPVAPNGLADVFRLEWFDGADPELSAGIPLNEHGQFLFDPKGNWIGCDGAAPPVIAEQKVMSASIVTVGGSLHGSRVHHCFAARRENDRSVGILLHSDVECRIEVVSDDHDRERPIGVNRSLDGLVKLIRVLPGCVVEFTQPRALLLMEYRDRKLQFSPPSEVIDLADQRDRRRHRNRGTPRSMSAAS